MGTGRTCAVSPCRNSTSALNSAARAAASSCPCASPSSSSCSPRRPSSHQPPLRRVIAHGGARGDVHAMRGVASQAACCVEWSRRAGCVDGGMGGGGVPGSSRSELPRSWRSLPAAASGSRASPSPPPVAALFGGVQGRGHRHLRDAVRGQADSTTLLIYSCRLVVRQWPVLCCAACACPVHTSVSVHVQSSTAHNPLPRPTLSCDVRRPHTRRRGAHAWYVAGSGEGGVERW